MIHASLFSGIGGFDLAAEWSGWYNAFNCEIDPFCRQVLKYHFPNAVQYEDIKTTDFTVWRGKIDVLTGGFPCQDASVAKGHGGGQLGLKGERTGLFIEMLRAIFEIKPKFVVAENVANYLKQMEERISGLSLSDWPQWGIMQNGELRVLQRSVPRNTGRGYTWLRTPVASDYLRANLSSPMYSRRLHRPEGCLPEQLYRLGFRGKMNYRFALMIMGFPVDWLELEPKK